jgi:hypothetical protein
MKQIITLSIALCFAIQINAQPVPVGHLTIFSEDGDKFFLILNGERQNNVAETNLRVEDLNQPYYNAKIIFEDKSLLEISKNYLQIADADGVFQDVTYKIKKDKTGKPKLNYFSMIPVRQGYIAPSNVTVLHYGQPAPPPPVASTTVTQTTTTRANTETVNVNVGLPGVGMNVTIVDPLLGGTTTTTTTRTTTTTTGYAEPAPTSPPPPARNVGCNGAFAMNSGDFQSALASINKQGYDETKLSTAKNIASKQCLSTNQVVQICKTFGFEQTKLDFAKFAYGRCSEQANYFKVNDVFEFSSSVEELNNFTSNQ